MQNHQNATDRKGHRCRGNPRFIYKQTFYQRPVMMVMLYFILVMNHPKKHSLSEAFLAPYSRAFYLPREQWALEMFVNNPQKQSMLPSLVHHQFSSRRHFLSRQNIGLHHTTIYQSQYLEQLGSQVKDEGLINPKDLEKPTPTAAGGFTHTKTSKAKISLANKGKTPWNKGKTRSDEVKARIAEGVRRFNREKFLKKLDDMGLTEEEYKNQKKEKRRIADAARNARKTKNGGYTPTAETRAKISSVLKEKHAKGEIKKRVYNGPFNKGFRHSSETKQKISETLKKKWSQDPAYQEKMRLKAERAKNVKQRISSTLKERWQNPEFRDKMMKSMDGRKPAQPMTHSQRENLSSAMKQKWLDGEYRDKMLKAMDNYRKTLPPKPAPIKKKRIEGKIEEGPVVAVPRKIGRKVRRKRVKKEKIPLTEMDMAKKNKQSPTQKPRRKKRTPKKDGDISRLREERRDLYDLLYGDETEGTAKSAEASDDLDNFDPYGLEEF